MKVRISNRATGCFQPCIGKVVPFREFSTEDFDGGLKKSEFIGQAVYWDGNFASIRTEEIAAFILEPSDYPPKRKRTRKQ